MVVAADSSQTLTAATFVVDDMMMVPPFARVYVCVCSRYRMRRRVGGERGGCEL